MFRVGHVWSVTKSLEHFNFKISDATSELEIREFYAYYTVRDLFHASANLITRLHDYTSHVCREETRCRFVSDPSGNLEIAVRMSIPSTLATHEREGGGGGWLVAERFKGVQVDEKLPLATLTQRCMASIPRGIFNLSFNFDKSRATGEPADQRYRGTRCLFANVHRALMNLDETRRDAPGSKQMDSSLSLSLSLSLFLFFSLFTLPSQGLGTMHFATDIEETGGRFPSKEPLNVIQMRAGVLPCVNVSWILN